MYLRIVSGKFQYPYSQYQLRLDTQAMFEDSISDEVMAAFAMFPVVPTPMPSYNHAIQTLRELPPKKDSAGVWHQQWETTELYADPQERAKALQQQLAAVQNSMANEIDAVVAQASAKPLRFTQEYLRREAQARGYLVDVGQLAPGAAAPPAPRLIANFAESAGLSFVEAARLTVKQADDLYAKLDALADLRMRKYEVRQAVTVEAARAAFEQILGEIQGVAATIT